MEIQEIRLPTIELEWSDWHPWDDIKIDNRGGRGVSIPNFIPGVYEARYKGSGDRLTIGKAADLRMRIREGLVKGKTPHSAGEDIRAEEDTARIEVRWARTDRPAAVEEELHIQYRAQHDGKNPKYVDHT